MPKLRLANDGVSLRAKPVFDWVTGTLSLNRLSADCLSCDIYPPTVYAYVWSGQSRTITGQCSGRVPWWSDEGSPQNWYDTGAEVSGGPGGASWQVQHPNMEQDGKYHIHASGVIGGVNASQDWAIGDAAAMEKEFPLAYSCSFSYPARLMYLIQDVGRGSDDNFWGPTGRDAGDTVDLRGYKTCKAMWMYWPDDGPGHIAVTVGKHTWTTTIQGTGTTPISAGMAQLKNACWCPSKGGNGDATLTASYMGSSGIPGDGTTFWQGDPGVDGITVEVGGDTIKARQAGSASDARATCLYFSGMQPTRSFSLTANLANATGHPYPQHLVKLANQDGPDAGSIRTDTNSRYPRAYGDEPGTLIEAYIPGRWSATGRAYSYQCTTWIGGATGLNILSKTYDSIGDPAFGWTMSPSGLTKEGQERNAWRCPISLSSWPALRIGPIQEGTIALRDWLRRDGTRITTDGTSLRVYPAAEGNPTTIYKVLGDTERQALRAHRYLRIALSGIQVGGPSTLRAEGKVWEFNLTSGSQEVTLDLAMPHLDDPAIVDHTTTLLGAANPIIPGHAWGIGQDPAGTTLEFSFPGEVTLNSISLPIVGTGYIQVMESIVKGDDRFLIAVDDDGQGGEIRTYARRILSYAPEGKVALDLAGGTVGSGYSTPPDHAARVYAIYELAEAANQVSSGVPVKNLRPKTGGVSITSDGVYWYTASNYFHNGCESYHLNPCYQAVNPADAITLSATYGVDRIEPCIGVDMDFVIGRYMGGAIVGIIGHDDAPVSGGATVSTSPAAGDDATDSHGSYTVPIDAHYPRVTQDYAITVQGHAPESETTPESTQHYHGVFDRVAFRVK